MKFFIRNTLFFIVGLLFLTIIPLVIFVHYISNKSSYYKISPTVTTIYMGDSYIECAINDSILPQSLNTGSSSETYFYSYHKLKLLLANNNSINQVYLGFSFHNLSIHNDETLKSIFIAPRYFYLLPLKEKFHLLYKNKNNLFQFIKNIIKQGFEILQNQNDAPYKGGFKNQFDETIPIKKSVDKSLLFHYLTNGEINPYSTINLYYLNKIIELCNSNEVKIILLNTPLHEYYYNKVPKNYIKQHNKVIDDFAYVTYIDLSQFNLDENCFSPDGCHVSQEGALKTSIELRRISQTVNQQ